MAKVRRLTGKECAYYLRSRCLKPVSPDALMAQTCSLIEAKRLVGLKMLDRLRRLERFEDAEDHRFMEIAQRHILKKSIKAGPKSKCPQFVSSGEPFPFCRHQHYQQCILKMPSCPGRCDAYFMYTGKSSKS